MTRTRFQWHEPPRRGNPAVLCEHCGLEIAAAATNERALSVNGVYEHIWFHVDSASPWCVVAPPPARPVDPFVAQRAIEHTVAKP